MKKRLLTAIGLSATFSLIGCADDQARSQLAATNAQVAQLQETVGVISTKVSTQKLVDILNKLDDLQNQINELNGNVDTLKQNQQNYKTSQDQLYQSIEQQIQALQGTAGTQGHQTAEPQVIAGTAAGIGQAADDDGTNSLKAGLRKIKSRNFPQAIKDFKNTISTSNNPDIIANATYYLCVAYAANGQYKDAIATARKFINDYPDNKNVPDAMRTIYISQTQSGMKKSAVNTADLLISKYPDSEAAKKVEKEISH